MKKSFITSGPEISGSISTFKLKKVLYLVLCEIILMSMVSGQCLHCLPDKTLGS